MTVALGGDARGATWDGRRVWVAAGDALAAYEAGGTALLRRPAGGLASVAPWSEGVVAVREPGLVVWFDGAGEEVARRAVGGVPVLVGGTDGAYCVDAASERAWAVAGPGTLGPPVPVPGVAGAAVARGTVWWTSRHDTLLRGDGMEVDLGVAEAVIAGCAGSVWAGGARGLLRVGAWGGDTSPPLPAPFEPALLACGDGRLVGASSEGVFVLDPSVDADARRLDVEVEATPELLVATKTSAWVFSGPESVIVAYR